MATQEVQKVIRDYLENHEDPTMADFVTSHLDLITRNTPSNKAIDKFWTSAINKEALGLKKNLGKSRVPWNELFGISPSNSSIVTPATSNPDNNKNDDPVSNSTPIHNNDPAITFFATSNKKTSTTLTASDNDHNNVTVSTNYTASSSSSSLGKRSRSSSAKTDSYELTADMKEEYKQAFEALDDEKKWPLNDGTKVEDVMYAYGASCTYEHPVHSFILDTEDKCWETVFTPSQLQQIKSTSNKPLSEYDESCKKMFSTLSQVVKNAKKRKLESLSSPLSQPTLITGTSAYLELTIKEEEDLIDELWESLAEFGLINPRKHYDLHWLQRTVDHILDLYRFKVLEWVKKNGSEMDFVSRVWTMLDQVFDDIMIETRRHSGSVATTCIDNEKRAVTGMAAISAKTPSIRPDLVLFKNGVEYGVAECGKGGDEEIGKKEIVETSLHCPKVMKSMLLHAVSKCDNDEEVTRALQVVGFSQFDLRMKILVMDNPAGYVCRIRSTPQYEISTIPSRMSSGVLPILKLTLKSKLTIQSSMKTVQDYLTREEDNEPDFRDNMEKNKKHLILPRLQKSPSKKPKKVA